MESKEIVEMLKEIEKAYFMLIPCVKNNVIQDYELTLVTAPNNLKALIQKFTEEA